jgi:parallel beta-helix repeat protein
LTFRHLKKYTMFIDGSSAANAYGVQGITRLLEEIVSPYLPIYVKAVLIPFEDRIIYDSLLAPYPIHFGGGYWHSLTLEDNIVEHNRYVGIAIEHGHDFTIRHNHIRHNEEGARLWTRGGTGFAGYTGDETTDALGHTYTLWRNQFVDNRVGASLARVADCHVEDNTFVGNVIGAVRLVGEPGVMLTENVVRDNATDVLRV